MDDYESPFVEVICPTTGYKFNIRGLLVKEGFVISESSITPNKPI